MVDTEIIRDRYGSPIPQYLDVSDKSGGSDGTMKPLTETSKVQLTGSSVEKAASREVRTADLDIRLPTPQGIKGCIVYLRVYTMTGTFGTGEGVGLETSDTHKISSSDINGLKLISDMNDISQKAHYWYPGAQPTDSIPTLESKVAGVPIGDSFRITIKISGTFATGEGVDCEVDVRWLI